MSASFASSIFLEQNSSPFVANLSARIATTSNTGDGFNEANIAFHVRDFISLMRSTRKPLIKVTLLDLEEPRRAFAQSPSRGESSRLAVYADALPKRRLVSLIGC